MGNCITVFISRIFSGKLVAQWPAVETKALLQLISENRSMLSSRRAGLFKKVADALHDLGINVSNILNECCLLP